MKWFQSIKGWFKKSEKKEEMKDFRALKSQAIKELEKLKKKKLDEKFLSELNRIFRIFIKERYELKRSLTYEELVKNELLKKVKIKKEIIDVTSKIHEATYKKVSGKTNFSSLLNQVEKIIKNS